MNPLPRPRLLAPAESPGDLSRGPTTDFHLLVLTVLREAMSRLPACRTLAELFEGLDQGARLLLPTAQTGFLLRQPDACLELVHCAPADAGAALKDLTDRLIEQGHFAKALKRGGYYAQASPDRHCLLMRIATPSHIYGAVLWVDERIPNHLQQALGALADLAGLSLDRFQGGAESFLVPEHPQGLSPPPGRVGADIAIPADQLTGLAHRAHFIRFLQQAILDSAPRLAVATLLLDIDGFHRVNRELGCEAGDQILRELARRLDEALRSRAIQDDLGIGEQDLCCARTGADEFGIALARVRDPHRLDALAEQLHSQIAEGFLQRGSRLYLSVSIGVASSEGLHEATSAEVMLRNADTALKRAKARGRNKHALFEPGAEELGSPHLRTESILQEALRNDAFTLHFQPLFHLASGRLAGAEVLLRLALGDGTPLPPSSFIPVAESTGQITEIGDWVARRACRQIRAWDALGTPAIPLAINVSAIELSQTDLPERLRAIVDEEGVSPQRLHLEITETAMISDMERTTHILRQLKALGVSIAMDDFGTGYSSLSTLRAFPFDKIKLDRSFMSELDGGPQSSAIIRAVLALGESLAIPVLAEGVETLEQLSFLRDQGCTEAQGYLLGRPKPVADDLIQLEARTLWTGAAAA